MTAVIEEVDGCVGHNGDGGDGQGYEDDGDL